MLYIFDKDGTLVESLGNRPANTLAEQRLLPGVVEKCAALRAEGHDLAVATNQGGVAFGYMTYAEAQTLVDHIAARIGAKWAVFCAHHPNASIAHYRGDCDCRKPKPGMIVDVLRQSGYSPDSTVYVGDVEVDRQAAEAAGVGFAWADEFFGRNGPPRPDQG